MSIDFVMVCAKKLAPFIWASTRGNIKASLKAWLISCLWRLYLQQFPQSPQSILKISQIPAKLHITWPPVIFKYALNYGLSLLYLQQFPQRLQSILNKSPKHLRLHIAYTSSYPNPYKAGVCILFVLLGTSSVYYVSIIFAMQKICHLYLHFFLEKTELSKI